ncbi:MAG: hypothetical protein FJY11_01160 [Bacteroidetes bacterium]|nr:hypothetical protein [Bacteroidota bacterium]
MKPVIRNMLIMSLLALILILVLPGENSYILTICFLVGYSVVIAVDSSAGTGKPDLRGLISLAAISLKFVVAAAVAVIWFRVLKNSNTAGLLLFFVVYLSFTITALFLILRNLKTKP